MKKITNNTGLGKLTMLLNCLFFAFLALTMFFLMKFDTINIELVQTKYPYEQLQESLRVAEHPLKQIRYECEYYANKADSLEKIPTPKNKKEAGVIKEEYMRVCKLLDDKNTLKATQDSIARVKKDEFEPMQKKYEELNTAAADAKSTYSMFKYISMFLFLVKIILFALWNYRNSLNLNNTVNWMGNKPYWAFVSWIIPIYNLTKPFQFFSEIWDETDYILKSKSILPNNDKSNNSDFTLGMWWGLFLVSSIFMSYCIYATFFKEGPMFLKMSHSGVVICTLLLWLGYLILETMLIMKYNKANKVLFDNQDKL